MIDRVPGPRRLRQLPELQAAFASGELIAAHVALVTSAVTPARVATAEENGISLAVTDQVLAAAARSRGPEDTATAVRHWVAGVDPDGALGDAADAARRFTMAASLGGRVHVGGYLDPVGAETVHAALEAVLNGDRPERDVRAMPSVRVMRWWSCAGKPWGQATCPTSGASVRRCGSPSTGGR